MNVSDYRTEPTAKLVKLDERQISIFKSLQRIEKHLEKLNGQTSQNSYAIVRFRTWGSAALFVVPIVITLIMRLVP